MDTNEIKRRLVMDKTGEAISLIKTAKNVNQVISALHSLAILLFPIDSSSISGSLDEHYTSPKIPSEVEREDYWKVFYRGAAFPTLARVLLLDVASNWLACFPLSARKHLYDVFFINGVYTEVVQILVPCLQFNRNDDSLLDVNAVQSNSERLLLLCLIENDGVARIFREFCSLHQSVDFTNNQSQTVVSRVSQIIASSPDKAWPRAPASLSSQYPYLSCSRYCGYAIKNAVHVLPL